MNLLANKFYSGMTSQPRRAILHVTDYILKVHVAPGCHDQLLAHGSASQATDASEIGYHYLIV